jgi:hypothetical protein
MKRLVRFRPTLIRQGLPDPFSPLAAQLKSPRIAERQPSPCFSRSGFLARKQATDYRRRSSVRAPYRAARTAAAGAVKKE